MTKKIFEFYGDKGIEGEEKLYSPWQITRILDVLGDFYYKEFLLLELKQRSDVKNVYVMDQSIKINLKYLQEDGESFKLDEEGILNIYHKGIPYSLFVTKESVLLTEAFKLFSIIFSKYNDSGVRLNKEEKGKKLYALYNTLLKKDIEEAIKYLKKEYEKLQIPKRYFESILKAKDIYSNYDIYLKLEEEDKNKAAYNNIRQYEKKFKNYFALNKRPIIYVEYEDSYQLLGSEFFNNNDFKHSNENFMETKQISQNSPLYISIAVSAAVAPSFVKLCSKLNEQRDENRNRAEIEKETADEIDELEREVDELDNELDILESENNLSNENNEDVIKKSTEILSDYAETKSKEYLVKLNIIGK
ncbi:TPA: hypothetical protein ACN2RH_001744 [Staphylococcus aureus]